METSPIKRKSLNGGPITIQGQSGLVNHNSMFFFYSLNFLD